MSAQPGPSESDASRLKEDQREAQPAQKATKETERPQQDETLLCTICHMPSCWR